MRSNGKVGSLIVGYLLAFHGYGIATVTWTLACSCVRCALPEPCSAIGSGGSNTTPLEVVFPSVGQTGTTSVSEAVRQLGYRTYHIEEKSLFTPDALADLQDPQRLVFQVSRCNVKALSLEPTVDVLRFVLETSPQAKYIMTWRDYPTWVGSTMTGGYLKDERWHYITSVLLGSMQHIPWVHLYDAVTGGFSDLVSRGEPFAGVGQGSVTSFLSYRIFGIYDSPWHNTHERGTWKTRGDEEAYIGTLNEIRQLVPPDRLLEFDVRQHGWAELAAFLDRPAPPTGTPFPRTRSKDSRTNDINFDRDYKNGLTALFISSVLHALNFMIFLTALRALASAGSRLASALAQVLLVVADFGDGGSGAQAPDS